MKTTGFKRWGCIYEPVHMVGFVITLLIIIFLVPVYVAIIRSGHSVADDLYHMFVYEFCTTFWMQGLHIKTAHNGKKKILLERTWQQFYVCMGRNESCFSNRT